MKMDVGIHLPTFRKPGGECECEETCRPQVLKDADLVLAEFKNFVESEYSKIDSLYQGAKNLFCEIHEHLVAGKKRIQSGEWTVDELDHNMNLLLHRQEAVWNRLMELGDEETKKVYEAFNKVLHMEMEVKHARGEGPSVAWLSFPTIEQAVVRKTYAIKLKKNFDEAKVEYNNLVGFPDGKLTMIPILRRDANIETARMLDKLRNPKKTLFLIPIPVGF